jgi:hypothetical protein
MAISCWNKFAGIVVAMAFTEALYSRFRRRSNSRFTAQIRFSISRAR